MQTKNLIAREIAVARISARRAARAVALFSTWLLVTWLGPEVLPSAGWTLWAIAAAVLGYGLLTVSALVAVWMWATRVIRTGVFRRVVTAHLAPFWMVAVFCACAGGAVWRAVDDPVASVWLGVGCGLTLLTAAYTLARIFEIRELERDQAQIALSPTEVALTTWKRELEGRIDAHGSIRLG